MIFLKLGTIDWKTKLETPNKRSLHSQTLKAHQISAPLHLALGWKIKKQHYNYSMSPIGYIVICVNTVEKCGLLVLVRSWEINIWRVHTFNAAYNLHNPSWLLFFCTKFKKVNFFFYSLSNFILRCAGCLTFYFFLGPHISVTLSLL